MTKLEKMLQYVSEHNDFYKQRIKDYGITNPLDITQWPVLTRKELQENRYNMFSDGYKSKYFNQNLRRQSSSGSTGMPVNVYWDNKDWYASNLCLWRKRQEWYGIKPYEKYCVFTLNAFGITPEEGKIYYLNEPKNVLTFNVSLIHDEKGYEKIAEIINDFDPNWLYIQPFVLNRLIMAYKNLNLEPAKQIRYIESVGEILTSNLKKRAEGMFRAKVTNMYGSEEMNGIAIESPSGTMHILSDNIFLEIRNYTGIFTEGEGESIITNLNNYAMPLIRYDQEDTIALNGYDYNCGCPTAVLIRGRIIDCLRYDTDNELNEYVLFEIIAEVNNIYKDIITDYEFAFIKASKTIQVEIALEPQNYRWVESVNRDIEDLFKTKYPNTCGFNICVLNKEKEYFSCQRKKHIKVFEILE